LQRFLSGSGLNDHIALAFEDFAHQAADAGLVIDDEDNCENVANADQTDADGDGKGAACDNNDSEGGKDSGTTDTAVDSGPGTDGPGDTAEELKIAGGCGCTSAPEGHAMAGALLLGTLLLRRRRS